MRLGVLDVGSNTVHLLVVDAYPGARPLPAYSHKAEIRLADHLDKGVEDFVGFATSAIRDAANGDEVLARITEQTGTRIDVLGGEDEARLTFLAARRWFGWSSGRLLVLDIGGGSLEIARTAVCCGTAAGPGRGHVQGLPAAGPGRGRGAVQRRPLRAPAAGRRGPGVLG